MKLNKMQRFLIIFSVLEVIAAIVGALYGNWIDATFFALTVCMNMLTIIYEAKRMKARNYFYSSFFFGLLVALIAFIGNTIVWEIIAGCYVVIAIFDLFAAIRES